MAVTIRVGTNIHSPALANEWHATRIDRATPAMSRLAPLARTGFVGL
jgi:hypothetical protein